MISSTDTDTASAVYVALKPLDETLNAVAAEIGCEPSEVTVVGGMARDMVRALKLKLGEVRRV